MDLTPLAHLQWAVKLIIYLHWIRNGFEPRHISGAIDESLIAMDDGNERPFRRAPRKLDGPELARSKRMFGNLVSSLGKIQKDTLKSANSQKEVKRREVEAKIEQKIKQDTTRRYNEPIRQMYSEEFGHTEVAGERDVSIT